MPHRRILVGPVFLFSALAFFAAACGGESGAAGGDSAASTPAAEPRAPAVSGAPAGRWSGEVTGGYKGNRVTFTLADGGTRMEDIVFEGHWDCEGGIETATLGPTGAFPLQGDSIAIVSVEPEDGGATAQRFEMHGRVTGGRAEGWLRIGLVALGCDTGRLSWSASPGA